MDTSERKWLERGLRDAVLAGDEAAWKCFYDACFDRLYAHVYYRVNSDASRAEEVVQDCWLVAVRRIRRFDPERGPFEQWMRGIADNVLRNKWRRWWRRRTAAMLADVPQDATAVGERLAVAEQVSLVLAGLPSRYEAVLRAKYEEQKPVTEIATCWNETPKAVESLLSRARRAFRKAYTKLDQGD
ncbi:MAG: sigma-70 family RNA polymerase sigma factor [Nitrospiraceae bacterium]|nr:sigma-70 family RNA polymerase sigma factor [Nitrospiraceae bacterium]